MARQARQISSTGYYHIVMRGNNKNYIFEHKANKAFFMEVLFGLEREGLFGLAAWCLMDNHVHLALKAEKENLTLAMKRLNIRFAMRYHLKQKSIGHVFQDRFASEVIESDAYLMNVIRYIHRNPVKAKMDERCEDYSWSSYGVVLERFAGDGGVVGGSVGTGPDVHKEHAHQGQSPLMPPGALEFVVSLFKSKKAYKEFHLIEDYGDYLEIREDRQKYQLESAQRVIDDFCKKHGIVDGKDIYRDRVLMAEVVGELEMKSRLSLRDIARLIGLPYSSLQEIRRRSKIRQSST